jgi:hypothetical protein
VRTLLAKIALHKAVGLYLGEHEVTVSQVAATLLGPVETASASQPYTPEADGAAVEQQLAPMDTPENLDAVIGELLAPLVGRKRRLPVAVGLAGRRLFFTARPLKDDRSTTPEEALQDALRSPNINVDELAIDLLRGKVKKLSVASLAVCRKKYMNGLLAALGGLGVRPYRAEPAPCALVRLAACRRGFPRRAETLLCVFLGVKEGLAVLVAGGLSLAWRSFPLPPGSEGPAILSAARTLRIQQQHYGIEFSPEYAVVHGRPDLHERLKTEQFASKIETRVLWRDGPEFDDKAIAFGLALGCLGPTAQAFDLSRTLKPLPSLWEIFPWWDLAFAGSLVALMGLALGAHSVKLNDSCAVAQAQRSRYKCLSSIEPDRLEQETQALAKRTDAVRKFLETRILWSNYTADVTARLPPAATLDALDGHCLLDTGGRGSGAKQSFAVGVRVPLAGNGSAPREIDTFLAALRNDPVLQHDFGSAELTGIKQAGSQDKRQAAAAAFGVICLPKGKADGSPAAKKEAK